MANDIDMSHLAKMDYYSHWTRDILRYGDTDRQGHINNAVFVTFFESGRVSILYDSKKPLTTKENSFVIARIILDYRAEVYWPNEISVGTAVLCLGNSSVTFGQGIFVNEQCVATAETVVVLIDNASRKSCSLSEKVRAELMQWLPNKK